MPNTSKPNILIFVPDEMRGEVITNPDVQMPNMRSIADDNGVIFTQNFSVNPVCAPSRVCTFTGQYPHNGGHRSLYQLLRKSDENFLHILKENGYEVIWIGRNDLFHQDAIEKSITKRIDLMKAQYRPIIREGFKRFGIFRMLKYLFHMRKNRSLQALLDNPDLADLFLNNFLVKNPHSKESKWYHSFYFGKISDEMIGKTVDDYIIEKAIAFLESYAQKKRKGKNQKPFCLYVPINFPHPPYQVEDPYFSMYSRENTKCYLPFQFPHQTQREKKPAYVSKLHNLYKLNQLTEADFQEILAVYYGMCTKVDALFGQLITKLKQIGEYKTSIISVFADHGDYAGAYGLTEKWPTGMEDPLLNVPFILKFPDLKPTNAQLATFTQTIDLFPSILEFLDISHPYTHFGKSLLPLLTGKTDFHRDMVFAEGGYDVREPQAFEKGAVSPDTPGLGIYYHKIHLQNSEPETVCRTTMVRTKDWKLILRTHPDAVNELYHLSEDPQELNNLYEKEEYTSKISELKDKMLQWYLKTSDNPYFIHKREA